MTTDCNDSFGNVPYLSFGGNDVSPEEFEDLSHKVSRPFKSTHSLRTYVVFLYGFRETSTASCYLLEMVSTGILLQMMAVVTLIAFGSAIYMVALGTGQMLY